MNHDEAIEKLKLLRSFFIDGGGMTQALDYAIAQLERNAYRGAYWTEDKPKPELKDYVFDASKYPAPYWMGEVKAGKFFKRPTDDDAACAEPRKAKFGNVEVEQMVNGRLIKMRLPNSRLVSDTEKPKPTQFDERVAELHNQTNYTITGIIVDNGYKKVDVSQLLREMLTHIQKLEKANRIVEGDNADNS